MEKDVCKTVAEIVGDNLCTGCGTCSALCPRSAVEMNADERGIYIPVLDDNECDRCGICLEVCPGHQVDFRELNCAIFAKEPEDVFIGNYQSCYTGHATDTVVRYNAASGGLITSLLIFALEEGIIDGALVTGMKKDNPLQPEAFIARTREEVIAASKSKYCPVPANAALKSILQESGRFAVVGLPCHIHGIRKAENINPDLKRKIVLHLGIFCNHVPNFWGTKLLLKRLKVKESEVARLDYRGEGWPGKMKITVKGGEVLLRHDYWDFIGSDFFTPARCQVCCDQTAELADISFGDAWLPGIVDDIGSSVAVSRSDYGEQLLQKAAAKRAIEIQPATANEIKSSQIVPLYFKKGGFKARLRWFKHRPLYTAHLPAPTVIDYLLSGFHIVARAFSQHKTLRGLVAHFPAWLMSLYRFPFGVVYSREARSRRSKVFTHI